MRSDYQPVLDYIETYWQISSTTNARKGQSGPRNLIMKIGQIKLPNSHISPNHLYFKNTQFYWDTYFTVLGLIAADKSEIAIGMVDNLLFLKAKFGLIPARNSLTSRGRSQPPFLTSMAWEIYETEKADKTWMAQVMNAAADEYEQVWNGADRKVGELNLSRYQPKYWKKKLTVYESGWDRSSRFKTNAIIPIDLNAQLYKYEKDLERWAIVEDRLEDAAMWSKRAYTRRKAIDKYLWSKEKGFYFDYDMRTSKQLRLKTAAGFVPLWAGASSAAQAKQCVKQLKFLEQPHGISNTHKLPWIGNQWDYPNGWPPHQWLVYQGLRNYGFNKQAKSIAVKYLDLVTDQFNKTGQLWEKYDVVSGQPGRSGRYPTQPGFAWTNAVFLKLYQDVIKN